MAKYCLTECAKEKLSIARKITIELTAVILFFVVGAFALGAILWVLGYLMIGLQNYFDFYFFKDTMDYLEIGLLIVLLIILLVISGILIYRFLKYLFLGTRSIVTNKMTSKTYWDEEFQCKIFERCDEDPEEDTEEPDGEESLKEILEDFPQKEVKKDE